MEKKDIKLEMSPDLKIAYVYVSSYEKISTEEVLDRIEQSKDFIAKEVVKLIPYFPFFF